MKSLILMIVRWTLLVWGGLSLVATIAFIGFVSFKLGPDNRDQNNSATSNDVRFVLNWCGLGEQRIEKVLHSHVSARSFTGDHLDAYAIKISHVDLNELTTGTDNPARGWYRGDQLPKVLEDAVEFVGAWLHGDEISWFPTKEELRSSEFYVYPWSIYYHGLNPTAVELIFIHPSDKMVFYFECKM